MFKDDGEFDGALAMVSDISERKRAEESLLLFRALIDESNDAIEVIDPETMCFLDVNRKACRELGYSRDEFLSLRVSDIDPTLDESSHSKLQKEIGEWAVRCSKESIDGKTGRHTRLKSISNESSWTGLTASVSFAILRNVSGRRDAASKAHGPCGGPAFGPHGKLAMVSGD